MTACIKSLLCVLQVESYFFDIRRQLFEYDQVMNTQRDKVWHSGVYVICHHQSPAFALMLLLQ